MPQEVSQQPSCVRVLPGKVFARRNGVFAELALGFEHLDIHARVVRVDEVDEVYKAIINGLVWSDNRW